MPYSLATWGENEFYGIGDHLIKVGRSYLPVSLLFHFLSLLQYNLSPENVAKGKAGIWKTQSFNAQSLAEVCQEGGLGKERKGSKIVQQRGDN